MHFMTKTTPTMMTAAFLAFTLASLGAFGASTDTEQAWIDQALASNAALASKLASAEAAAERIEGADSWQDPNLNLMVAPGTLAGDNDIGQRIEISQALPWPGSLDARRTRAEARAKASGAQYQWSRDRLVAAVRAAYAEWWFINQAIALHHENQALVEELLGNATEGYAYGGVRQTDLLQLRRELSELDMQQYQLTEQRQALAARIANLLGERPDLEPVVLSPGFLKSVPDLPTAVDGALAHHPLQAAAKARIEASGADVKIHQLDKYPKVKVMAGYNSLWADRSKRTVVGIGLEIPFSGRRQQGALNAAESELQAQRWEAIEQARAIEAEVTQAWEKVNALTAGMEILETRGVPLAEEHWQASLEQLASQQGDYEDAILSARKLTRTHLEHARLKADAHRSLAELQSWIRLN